MRRVGFALVDWGPLLSSEDFVTLDKSDEGAEKDSDGCAFFDELEIHGTTTIDVDCLFA